MEASIPRALSDESPPRPVRNDSDLTASVPFFHSLFEWHSLRIRHSDLLSAGETTRPQGSPILQEHFSQSARTFYGVSGDRDRSAGTMEFPCAPPGHVLAFNECFTEASCLLRGTALSGNYF